MTQNHAQLEIRDISLVRMSYHLALFFEVIPIELNLIGSLWSYRAVLLMVAVKVIVLTAILLPLVIYVLRNGAGALRLARGRVIAVIVIIAVNLALNILMMWLA